MDKPSGVIFHTGRTMPVMGLGTWQLTDNTAGTIAYALSLGYPMIDTSSDYGTQPGIAEGIKKSGVSRDTFFLVTKVEETDNAYERSLSNLDELGLEYVDLMLIHRPPVDGVGEKLWEELIRAREDGLTRDIGVSNYSADQISQLVDATGEVPVVNQIEWSPFGHSANMMKYAHDHDIIIQAYSPLTRAKRLDDKALGEIGQRHDKSPAQILIRWSMQDGAVPIPKANQREHLDEDIDVFDFSLTGDEMRTLNNMNEFYSALGELPYVKNESIGESHAFLNY